MTGGEGMTGLVKTVVLAATLSLIAGAAPAGAAVLYDQYIGATAGATNSQDYETANNNNRFNDRAADDFVVPVGESWTIDEVDVKGASIVGSGAPASFNVSFYANGPGNLPADPAVATRTGLAFTNTSGDFVIPLTTPVTLTSGGTYWVSVQARMDFTPAGEWGWTDNTFTFNNGAAWENPPGGHGDGCTTWARRTTCGSMADAGAADQVFRLRGTAQTTATYTAQTSTGASIVPGTTDVGNHGNDVTTSLDFPFPVKFYGQNFSSGAVDSNGNLQLDTDSSRPAQACLPSEQFGAAIMPSWADLRTDQLPGTPPGRGIFTATTGAPPHRTFVIEWRASYNGQETTTANFEIKLYEDSPIITVIYGPNARSGENATAGVQGYGIAPSTHSTQFACNTAGTIADGLRVDYVPNAVTLGVDKNGSGGGTVTSDDGRLDCGATCSRLFPGGSNVTLTAAPDAGSRFAGWSGGGCSGSGACTVTMSANQKVSATFTVNPPPPPPAPTTTISKAKINQAKNSAKFRFKEVGGSKAKASSGFQCALLKKRHARPKFRACTSPKRYRHLKPHRYTFEVRAFDSAGKDPTPAKKKFKIK